MADFQLVAQGSDFDSIVPLVEDFQLYSGDRVLVTLDTLPGMGYTFNAAGAEKLFSPPESMFIVDVWGDANHGYVLMQATSPPLLAVLAAIPAWAYIIIAIGIAVAAITLAVSVAVQISKTSPSLVSSLAIGGAIVVGGIVLYQLAKRGKS